MDLKGRLGLIAKKVPECDVVADIGTDHAFIPIYLIKAKRCKRAIASDARSGPAKIAIKNIKANGLEEKIAVRVGDGLKPLNYKDIDVIVIAGMGGDLIVKILEESIEKAKSAKTLILQPMTSKSVLREWLLNNGFEIYDEELVAEATKIYTVLSVYWTGKPSKEEFIYYLIGRKLIENRDPLLEKLIKQKLYRIDRIIRGLEKSKKDLMQEYNKFNLLKEKLIELISKLY